MTDYRIGAALINKYYRSIISNKNDATEMADRMLAKVNVPNDFATIVNSYRFQNQIKNFILADNNTLRFPELTIDDLKKISLGTYQISLISSYCAEIIEKFGIRLSTNYSINLF